MMNYSEARQYLTEVTKYGSVPGLDSIRELMRRLGNPQDKLKFIHIAGTNGKGSVLAYLSTILKKAGYRTGRYVSPTLFSYRERIQVDGDMIGREDLARLTEIVRDASEDMERDGLAHPTSFETETAVAWLYF
ncbi:MAG TPA: bifunctional folylpolyglutamate synthase/dihydrofolate synthase, partial [Candidatus Blautia excrementigallinarum]|nr:bifunctional folylpolyglutamate synthase/dihydrofolate synthase [Candidatus Blautia excrementigallinarum]